jgi:16S rRNA (cytidine1402-2'-O)-methyltransferase
VLDAVVACCQGDTLLCIATDLTLPTESIGTLPVSEWKNRRPSLDRRPSVFVLYRETSARNAR